MKSDFGNRYLISSTMRQYLPKLKRLLSKRQSKNLALRSNGKKLERLLRQTKLDAVPELHIVNMWCRNLTKEEEQQVRRISCGSFNREWDINLGKPNPKISGLN